MEGPILFVLLIFAKENMFICLSFIPKDVRCLICSNCCARVQGQSVILEGGRDGRGPDSKLTSMA